MHLPEPHNELNLLGTILRNFFSMPLDVDLYRAPTVALLTALVTVLGVLCLRARRLTRGSDGRPPETPTARRRELLWLAGWIFAVTRLALQVLPQGRAGIGLAISRASMETAALMFLASLAPQYFSRRPRILYVVAFGIPLIAFAVLSALDPVPGPAVRASLIACTLAAMFVAVRWSLYRYFLPELLSLLLVGTVGGGCMWLVDQHRYDAALTLVHSGILLMTALLFAATYRRLTAGVVFTVGGLVAWSLPVLLQLMGALGPGVGTMRALNLVKVITAVGMIVLILEDEIASNLAAQQRDRRARLEMEKYSELYVEAMPYEETAGPFDQVCETIARVSRFRKAVIFLRTPENTFRLAGKAGIDGALEGALEALAQRTTDEKATQVGNSGHAKREIGNLMLMDLTPLMQPGDELRQMNFLEAHVIGIRARDRRLLGGLLLADPKNPQEPMAMEDVLPLELLVARIAAAREHQALVRRLVQSERLAGLGQLAGGVAHELNNPLTVVTGYAELLGDSENSQAREHALVILNEARRMKQIIESLMRFRRASPAGRDSVSIELLLQDIEKLARHDIESAHIDLQIRAAKDLPRVRANGEQLRQVFLQVIKNAVGSMEEMKDGAERKLTIEALESGNLVQVMFSDTGPGFAEPGRAFDPFFTTRHPGEGVGLGLSICYSIIREHGGEMSAVNLHPRGAAVVIEFPSEETPAVSEPLQTFESPQPRAVMTDGPAHAV